MVRSSLIIVALICAIASPVDAARPRKVVIQVSDVGISHSIQLNSEYHRVVSVLTANRISILEASGLKILGQTGDIYRVSAGPHRFDIKETRISDAAQTKTTWKLTRSYGKVTDYSSTIEISPSGNGTIIKGRMSLNIAGPGRNVADKRVREGIDTMQHELKRLLGER